MRRGFSLLEILAVLAIGIAVLLALGPVTKDVFVEERRLAAEILDRGDFRNVLDRMARDLSSARQAEFLEDGLAAAGTGESSVRWQFRAGTVTRRETRGASSAIRRWSLPGDLRFLASESGAEYVVLRFQPRRGRPEVVVLPVGSAK